MKKTLLQLLFLSLSIITFAQNNYYWSAGRKNYIQEDTGVFVIKYRQNVKIENVRASLLGKLGIRHITSLRNNVGILNASRKSGLTPERLRTFTTVEDAMPAYRLGKTPFYLTGEILLQPKPGISIEQILKLINNHATIKSKSKYNTFVLEVDNWNKLLEYANQLYTSGLVKYSHPNFIAPIERTMDPLYAYQYYLDNTGQTGGTAGIDINAPGAWSITKGNILIRVAVIDDGVETHEELAGRILPGFTARTTSTYPDTHGAPNATDPPSDQLPFGHGECCAGIIAASHNDMGIRGVAPNVQIVPINIFNDWYINSAGKLSFHEDANDAAAAIDWAWDDGQADVLINSWGYHTGDSYNILYADNIIAAINRAQIQGRNGLGSVVVFASGNFNPHTGCTTCFDGVAFPSDVNGVITVGSIDKNGNITDYSSRGPEMDLVAPSGESDVYTTDRMGSKGYDLSSQNGNYFSYFGGTSAACPQVSGVVALMLSVNPTLTVNEVRTILHQTATDLGPAGFDNTYGYGLVNACKAVYEASKVAVSTISGPSYVCNSTFTLNNRPSGTTVNWIHSSNISYVSGQGTDNYTVEPASSSVSEMGWVKAIISSPCDSDTIEKNVWVGVSGTPSILIIPPLTKVGPNSTIEVIGLTSGAENYNWTVAGASITSGQGTSDIWIRTVSCTPVHPVDLYIQLVASNSCGNSSRATLNIPFDCSGGPSPLLVSPNPASQALNVEVVDTASGAKNQRVNKAFTVQIFDPYNKIVLQKQETLRRFSINVSGYRTGVYYLRVIKGNKVYSKKIIITH